MCLHVNIVCSKVICTNDSLLITDYDYLYDDDYVKSAAKQIVYSQTNKKKFV
jgi:hypothetical protein